MKEQLALQRRLLVYEYSIANHDGPGAPSVPETAQDSAQEGFDLQQVRSAVRE